MMRRGSFHAIAAVVAAYALWSAAFAGAAGSPVPALDAHSIAVPTYFRPGDTSNNYYYELSVINDGGAFTDGTPLEVTDKLPEGLLVEDVELLLQDPPGISDYGDEYCTSNSAATGSTVQCVIPADLPNGTHPALIGPQEGRRIRIRVSVPAGTPEGEIENEVSVTGGGSLEGRISSHNRISRNPVPAGLQEFVAAARGVDGERVTQAGSHPYLYETSFAVNSAFAPPGGEGEFGPAGGDVRNIDVALPPGLIGNPLAVKRCAPQEFNATHNVPVPAGGSFTANSCPDDSVVGVMLLRQLEGEGGLGPVPIYNLAPSKGMPAQLGFQVLGAPFYIDTKIRSGSDYGVTAYLRNASEARRVTAATVFLWGAPGDSSHDATRGSCLNVLEVFPFSMGSCPVTLDHPLLRMPTSCEAPLFTQLSLEYWNGASAGAVPDVGPALVGCDALGFAPAFAAEPSAATTDSPSGLHVDVHLPQQEVNGLAEADLRDAVVRLPKGMTVNPASAGGLQGCSAAEIGLTGDSPAACPEAAKIGSVIVHTPLLDHPVAGAIYVAEPWNNPFNSLLALYLVAYDPATGVVLKIPGRVEADHEDGQLTAVFKDNPQLPFEDLEVDFFPGARAALRTPSTCGNFTTVARLRPWSAADVQLLTDSFDLSLAPGGGHCAPDEAQQPHHPSFEAGSVNIEAGKGTPFVLKLKREDGSQTLRLINTHLPEGLLAKLAGVAYCPESALANAARRQGRAEQADPSCPSTSRIGSVDVAVGAGAKPLHIGGTVYLAGPYKNAPLSLAIVTPAVAGPFDLGTVVVRAALEVDPESTRVSVLSDPIPTILEGIPVDLRSIEVNLNPGFVQNPTSCREKSIAAEAVAVTGSIASMDEPFQVDACNKLRFAPTFMFRIKGKTKRTGHPAITAVVRAGAGEANIAWSSVLLPHTQQIDNAHIGTPCTRPQFEAAQCPKSALMGSATAVSPLLSAPLKGPVYFRSNGGARALPDMVADLRGQIHVVLVGYIDAVHGRLRTRFAHVPDAPISEFRLHLLGGRKGLVVNNTDLCAKPYRVNARFKGQNGKKRIGHVVTRTPCRSSK